MNAAMKLFAGLVQATATHIPLRDESVQCIVTSPPYWGLRSYAGEQRQVWGGEPQHEHEWQAEPTAEGKIGKVRWQHSSNGNGEVIVNRKVMPEAYGQIGRGGFCACDAWLGALGLEPEPAMYVEHIVAIFRECWRVLRKDGVVFLNLGDSYAGSGKGPSNSLSQAVWDTQPHRNDAQARAGAPTSRVAIPNGLKPKDLVGIPWRVALALQADGWWLRSAITWCKSNPVPESVRDRPTKATEMVFLLAKSERYYYDQEAAREPSGANMRDFWQIAPQPYPGAHFATFPEKLAERCILAGSALESVVLDPFVGTGTTGRVAVRHGRAFVGLDISREYLSEQAAKRIDKVQRVMPL